MGDSAQTDPELDAFARVHGYVHVKRIPGDLLVAITPLTFGRARLNVGTMHEVLDGY